MRYGGNSDATPASDGTRSAQSQTVDISIVYFIEDCERSIRSSVRGLAAQTGQRTCELIAIDCGASADVRDIFQRETETNAIVPSRVVDLQSANWADHRFERFIQSLNGHYVAFLSANVTWCDPNKISEEARFLDEHGECYGVTSNHMRRYQRFGQFSTGWSPTENSGLLGHEQLIRIPVIPLLSATMFRASALVALQAPGVSAAHLAWVCSLMNAGTGFLGRRSQVGAVLDDWDTTPPEGLVEAERANLLAQLRVIDRVTEGRYRQDFEALADAYRRHIAGGSLW